MIQRILLFLSGAVLAAAGGYAAWLARSAAQALFPPGAGPQVWILIAGILGVCSGLVFMVAAFRLKTENAPPHTDRDQLREAVRAADAEYAQKLRAADRDWRDGPLPPGPAEKPTADEKAETAARTLFEDEAEDGEQPERNAPFPSSANLSAIPAARAPQPETQGDRPAAKDERMTDDPSADTPDAFTRIREAIATGQIGQAERLLEDERTRLKAQGDSARFALAELTAIAGDCEEAAGRHDKAVWLWRRALNRFTEADAASAPLARMLSERLDGEPD